MLMNTNVDSRGRRLSAGRYRDECEREALRVTYWRAWDAATKTYKETA